MTQSNKQRTKELNSANKKWVDAENTKKFKTFLDGHVKAIRG